jgi:deaminated glutathione amidase
MKDSLKLSTISLCATTKRDENIANTFALMEQCVRNENPDWLLIPEVFAYVGTPPLAPEYFESDDSDLVNSLSDFARKHNIVLFAGSVHEKPETADERPYNTMYIFGRDGEVLGKYRKIHLFALRHPSGRSILDETATFQPGDKLLALDIDGYRVAASICYDLRFPLLYDAYYRQQAFDIIVIPSAFTKRTGAAHWEVLLRARAIEFQCYVFAANQTGQHAPGRESFGHSMIVDPWGEILADTGEEIGYVTATVERQRLIEVRATVPSLANRKEI